MPPWALTVCITGAAVQVLVVLVWVGVVATLAEFCWELAWKMQRVRTIP